MSEKEQRIEEAPGATALLIVDMINDLDFAGGDALAPPAEVAAAVIARLRDAADAADLPVVYVNDNYGQWHSDKARIIEHCGRDKRGGALIEQLRPRDRDYFIVKPKFSGFYATNLPVLLPKLGVSRLVLTGIAADICVLFTAADAHMRDYDLWVPRDAVASVDKQRTDWALDIMAESMAAEIGSTDDVTLDDWLARAS